MPITSINGTQYYFEISGKGKPIVLISGYGADHTYWQQVAPALAKDHQVIQFDNRGCGQTKDGGGELCSVTMAQDTWALIQMLGLIKPNIVGQSMGGTIAQQLAMYHGDALGRLALLNTAARWRLPMLKWFQYWLKAVKSADSKMLNDLVLIVGFGQEFLQNSSRVEAFLALVNSTPYPQSYRDALRQYHVLESHDARAGLHTIKNDALVMLAKEDCIAPLCDAQQLVDSIANADLLTIDGGHSSCFDQPEVVSQHLLSFLR